MIYFPVSATTYSSMRRQFDREILKLVPFTASDTFRGQFEKVRKPNERYKASLSTKIFLLDTHNYD